MIEIEDRAPEEMEPEVRERDTRTFVERVDQINIGFIVSTTPDKLKEFAELVDKAIEATGGTLRYTMDSSKRLSLREYRPPFRGRDDRRGEDRRDDRRDDRRRFDYGTR